MKHLPYTSRSTEYLIGASLNLMRLSVTNVLFPCDRIKENYEDLEGLVLVLTPQNKLSEVKFETQFQNSMLQP